MSLFTRPKAAASDNRWFSISEPLHHEGPKFKPSARKPYGYRWYDPDRQVLGKRMEEQLRFAVCWWHTLVWPGSDPFEIGRASCRERV